MIQQAVVVKLFVVLEWLDAVRTLDSRREDVLTGYHPEREILTSLGSGPARLTKARDYNALPKRQQGKAKAALQNIGMVETREAGQAWQVFIRTYQTKYPQAVAKLQKDRGVLLTFYDFPAEHWRHFRSSNSIEPIFTTVRHRTSRTKNCISRNSFLGLSFKFLPEAEKHWRGIQHSQRLRELFAGVVFIDGIPANETKPEPQQSAA